MLKRKIEDVLLTWKQEENHKPIVIKGCRQCGKTFSVMKFAHENISMWFILTSCSTQIML